MKASEIINLIENETAPLCLAEPWDSPGLKTGSPNAEIYGITVCLDVTVSVIEEAVCSGHNMIVSHHPLIFGSVHDVCDDTKQALCAAVRNNMCVYSAHTNLDYADGGINDALAAACGITDIKKDASGHHRFGSLSERMPLAKYAGFIRSSLSAQHVGLILPAYPHAKSTEDITVSEVGVSSGAFDGDTKWAKECGIDILVTGEIKHSDAVALTYVDLAVICAGHYHTEMPGVVLLAENLRKRLERSHIPVKAASSFRPPIIFSS